MTIKIIDETFSVCKVADYKGIDLSTPFVFIGLTDEEKSLVCPVSQVPDNTFERDDGWKAFRIEGTLDFSLIGILADISKVLAQGKVGIFAISTYNTDYILTKSENFERAICLLQAAGYSSCQGTDTVLKTKLFGLKVRHFNNSCLLIAFTRSIHALFSM